jgi:exo-1,4-beta-D-glucosaminidase
MGQPHLERLTVSFAAEGQATDEQSVDFGIREITSELTANGSRLFRVNGKPILIRGAGWSQDMLLRTDEQRLRDQFRLVRDMNLNTIRLEGKLETEDFFHLADEQGILVMLGWCCCDHWEHWKDWTPENLTVATASLRDQMLRLRHTPACSSGSTAATIRRPPTSKTPTSKSSPKPTGPTRSSPPPPQRPPPSPAKAASR